MLLTLLHHPITPPPASNDEKSSYQMVVVCGNNEGDRFNMEGQIWGGGVEVKVMVFVNSTNKYTRSRNTVITKAGPGTIAEVSICELPCMISPYL